MITLTSSTRLFITVLTLAVMVMTAVGASIYSHRLDQTISSLRSDVEKNRALSDSLWDAEQQKSQKIHTLMLFHASDKKADEIEFIRMLFPEFRQKPSQDISYQSVIESYNFEKEQSFARINDLYLESQNAEDRMFSVLSFKATLMNIALFIQLLCVTIVTVVRDLR